jgi:hypothetical protein
LLAAPRLVGSACRECHPDRHYLRRRLYSLRRHRGAQMVHGKVAEGHNDVLVPLFLTAGLT